MTQDNLPPGEDNTSQGRAVRPAKKATSAAAKKTAKRTPAAANETPQAASRRRLPKEKKVSAAGGAGGGTLMLTLSHAVGVHTVWGTILTWLSPSFAAVTGTLMGMVALLGAHWTKWFQVRLSVGRLKKIAKDPNTPAEDKAEILQGLQEVNRVRARHETKRIKDVLE